MTHKSPQKNNEKKVGKSLKEKRAVKKAKKEQGDKSFLPEQPR